MKLFVFFLFQILPWIALVGDWALRWTEGSEALQITFVMFVFPVIMNALQYYIIDSFIKDNSAGEHEPGTLADDESGRGGDDADSLLRDDESDRASIDEELDKDANGISKSQVRSKGRATGDDEDEEDRLR